MYEIINRIMENQLYYKDSVVLKYKIQYPQIINGRNSYSEYRFNEYNYEKANELREYCENELYKEAKKLHDLNGYPIMQYEVYFDYHITYNRNNIISLYTDEYMYLGGAHGNTKREGQTWNMQNGRMIMLKEFFRNNPYYIIDILKQINSQIEKQMETENGMYFENYCNLVQENLRLENFYITEKGVVIFFNQYEIAPYSSGIPTFLIR